MMVAAKETCQTAAAFPKLTFSGDKVEHRLGNAIREL